MAKVNAIDAPRSLNRAVMHCERYRVALAERNYLWPRLHTRSLLGEDEFAARKISLGFGQQDGYLYWEDVLPVEVLMQAVEVTFAILKE